VEEGSEARDQGELGELDGGEEVAEEEGGAAEGGGVGGIEGTAEGVSGKRRKERSSVG